MRTRLIRRVLCVFVLLFSNLSFAQSSEIELLRAAMDELRADYAARIDLLEKRLADAERNINANAGAAAEVQTRASGRGAGSTAAFNPAIGVIFEGQAWDYSKGTDDYFIQGFPLGGEAGPVGEGFAIGETEINISANVDDKFSAWLTVPVVIEDGEAGVEIEEAWVNTTALPAGLSARFGRFFSGIGYLNSKHAHSWDFSDQPLPYQAFLGDQFLDDGLQVRWIAPTELYVEAGAELFRGNRYPAGGAAGSDFGANSLFVNMGGDVGSDHSWLAGLSYLGADSIDRASGDEDDPVLFSGETDTTIAQFVWKWAPNGNWKQRNLVIQSEWFWRSESGAYTLPAGPVLNYEGDQRGSYLQAVYQPFPRWRFGARFDTISMDDVAPAFGGTLLAAPLSDPKRFSLMTDWSNSEFSRVRLQFIRDQSGPRDLSQWGVQYLHSIGAHGAHAF